MSEKQFKPSRTFLEKVERGEVAATFGYSARRGGFHGFRGGEATYEKHRMAGYCNGANGASLGRPGVAKLTEKGIAWLNAARSGDHHAA